MSTKIFIIDNKCDLRILERELKKTLDDKHPDEAAELDAFEDPFGIIEDLIDNCEQNL